MYTLIDKEKMIAVYRHHNSTFLSNLMHIEFPHCRASIVNDDPGSFRSFSDLELRLLYENLCDQKFVGYPHRETLLANVVKLCQMLPESELNGFELSLQAESIKMEDHGIYRYAPGKNVPSEYQDLYTHSKLTVGAGFTPVATPTRTASAPPAPHTQAASVPKAVPVPRTNAPSSAPISSEAPKSGSKTGRVWEIAEDIWQKANCPSNTKDIRRQIVDACEAEGINGNTASVQYSKWAKTKL